MKMFAASLRPPSARPLVEALEDRCLPSASTLYSVDGTGNNLAHLDWGSVGQDLLRFAAAAYGDGVSTLAGANRPSARLISDVLVTDPTDGDNPNNRFLSDWVYAWGQFIDHDLDLTTTGTGSQAESANIAVPTGDPFFDPNGTGTQVIPFNRSAYDPNTGTNTGNPRQQTNSITAWLDASMVYGSSATVADALRTHQGGRLKTSPGADGVVGTSDDLLPYNNQTYFSGIHLNAGNANAAFTIANDAHLVPDDQLFMAGDVRVNENIELTSVHTLFVRQHNRIADFIARNNPSLSDEQIFQMARSIVIAEIQSITYNEFLPALLGASALPGYAGYNPNVNPNIATEFSTAAFRLGHSLLAPDVEFLNPDGTTKAEEVSLAESFFNPGLLAQNGADPILKYLGTDNAQELDNMIVPELQNFLFGPPGAGGFDLASLNIQRGRDHGLANYNTMRAAYGLPKVTSFAQITSNTALQAKLQQLYGNVNNIDAWVGGLAEDHVAGGSVGPLFTKIIANQFQRLRSGDRLWFENQFSGSALGALEHTTLAQIIARNTVNKDLQGNIFFFKMQIIGTVFNDPNRNGARDRGEAGVAGRVIQLLDAAGTVVAQTTTRADGSYSFDNLNSSLDPATAYRVVEVLPNDVTQTTANPKPITFSRGQTFSNVNFGNVTVKGTPPGKLPGVTPVSDRGTDTGPLDGAGLGDVVRALLPGGRPTPGKPPRR